MNGDALELGTADLLHRILDRGSDPQVKLEELLEGFERRAYGVLLLVASLPTLVPGVAAVSGPIVALAGAQLMVGLHLPWLPQFVRRRRFERSSLVRVLKLLEPWLRRLERLCKPRWQNLWRQGGLRAVGLVLVVLGLALALPIPFTNYVIAVPIVVLAFGLTEHDGLVVVLGLLSGLVALAVVSAAYWALLVQAMAWLFG